MQMTNHDTPEEPEAGVGGIGRVEPKGRHRFERDPGAALAQKQPGAELALEECRFVVLVVPDPVLTSSIGPAALVDVVSIGIEVDARHSVLVLKRTAAVRVWPQPFARPRAQVLADRGVDQELGL